MAVQHSDADCCSACTTQDARCVASGQQPSPGRSSHPSILSQCGLQGVSADRTGMQSVSFALLDFLCGWLWGQVGSGVTVHRNDGLHSDRLHVIVKLANCAMRSPDEGVHVLVRPPLLREAEVTQLQAGRGTPVQQRVVQLQVPAPARPPSALQLALDHSIPVGGALLRRPSPRLLNSCVDAERMQSASPSGSAKKTLRHSRVCAKHSQQAVVTT